MKVQRMKFQRRRLFQVCAAIGVGLWIFSSLGGMSAASAEVAMALPAPMADEPATARVATAVLAGGCFWGVQGVFQHVQGVRGVVSGYAGGARETARYERIGRGDTGHAEAVQISYDPAQVTYGQLLQIFFSVAHDPTQLNRQGPDVGTQYRSAIFPADDAQRQIAAAYVAQLDKAHSFSAALATRIEPVSTFYPAEAYHQNFLALNPRHPYIAFHDLPKVDALHHAFPDRYRVKPVLVDEAH